MNAQRLRNITTGRLHTNMSDIYTDIERLVGVEGIFAHQLPNALTAMTPWLKERITDERYWDDKYDPDHQEEIIIVPMNEQERDAFWKRYGELPSLLSNRS